MEEAARHSTVAHQDMWDQAVEDAIAEASTEMGVQFVYDVDKDAFRKATSSMLDKYSAEYLGVKHLLALISNVRAGKTAEAEAEAKAIQEVTAAE